MNFEILISNQTPREYVSLITDFWQMDENKSFIYSIGQLSSKYKLTHIKIKSVIEKFSGIAMYLDQCALCRSTYKVVLKKRKDFDRLEYAYNICDLCSTYSPNSLYYDFSTRIDIRCQYQKISDKEKFILNGMVHLKSKMLIYKHIFNNNLNDKEIWKIVNSLERNGLIYIDRNDDCSIKAFRFPTDIIALIKDDANNLE